LNRIDIIIVTGFLSLWYQSGVKGRRRSADCRQRSFNREGQWSPHSNFASEWSRVGGLGRLRNSGLPAWEILRTMRLRV